mgnify:FL=1|jgi:hypothetical protein
MTRFSQGVYTPKNPKKYAGKGRIKYRSSWELKFCDFCDNNQHILEWASESIRIPYRHPLTGKKTHYVPDFLVVYGDKFGKTRVELIEIKPDRQTKLVEGMNQRERAVVAVNTAKWEAAQHWAKQQGIVFRIITEKDMFRK